MLRSCVAGAALIVGALSPLWAAAQPPPTPSTSAQPAGSAAPVADAPPAEAAPAPEQVPSGDAAPSPADAVPAPEAAPSPNEPVPSPTAGPSPGTTARFPPPAPLSIAPSATAEEAGVDIISTAGKHNPPPKRGPSIVLAGDGPKVVWNPRWRRFALGNYLLSGLSMGMALGSLAIPVDETRWNTANSFDTEIRGALRRDKKDHRDRDRDASDILLMVSTNQILVDTLLVTWWGHDADTVAFEMALMNIETLTVNTAINGLVSGLASRERPYGQDCVGEDADALRDCRSSKRYRSFYSGHTSTTFAVAGLTCIHHAYLPLYGGGFFDVIPCISSFGVAAATGVLRVSSDQHYGSDVMLGAAMGTLTGLAVPYLLHYRTGELPEDAPDGVSWIFVPTPFGAQLGGTF